MNTCRGKHTQTIVAAVLWDNCPCLSLTAHIKYTKTKCPFQHRQGGGGVQPSPPKIRTKVCPCCHGQNMPFCREQTDAVVMYSAALQ